VPSDPHVIRLRSAWRANPNGHHVRRFNRPTGLGGGERVRLVAELGEGTSAWLNGQSLDCSQSLRCEVTDRLEPHNELTIVLAADADARVLESVRLEISEE